MSRNRASVFVLLGAVLVLALAGCGRGENREAAAPPADANQTQEQTVLPEEPEETQEQTQQQEEAVAVRQHDALTQEDFLTVSGADVVNRKGETVYLRGTNAGGLFVQENWMNANNSPDYLTTLQVFYSHFGMEKAYELLGLYEDNFWTDADFDRCAQMGMSVIRLPFTYMTLYRYDTEQSCWVLREDAFDKMDWFVENCASRGMYVILDLHGAFGSQNGQDHSGQTYPSAGTVDFFSNEEKQAMTLELWRLVAQHYRDNPAVAAYDTLNEPGEKGGATGGRHWVFYDAMYQAIREEDPDHILIFESCWEPENLPLPSKYGWENIIYEYHHYAWDYVGDTQGQKDALDAKLKRIRDADYGVPTLMGEFTCFEQWDAWAYELEAFNQAGIHWTSWTYKTTDAGSWGIFSEKTTQQANVTGTEEEIREAWSAASIGTGEPSCGGKLYDLLLVYLNQ